MSAFKNKQQRLFKILFYYLIAILFLYAFNARAANTNGYLEISHSTASDSIDSARTFALYSPPMYNKREQVYAGLRITQFDLEQISSDTTLWRIFLGATIDYTVAPFIEIGTDLLGLFLVNDNNDEDDCLDNNNKCKIDGYLRIGLRYQIHDNFIIGVFHETISFGDFHNDLKGDHNYFGVSIGMKF